MQDDDPRVPGRSLREEALFAFLFGALAIFVMGALAHAAQTPFIFPSLGPSAFLMFHRPLSAGASPRNTVQGHLIGVVCGVASLAVCGLLDTPSAFEEGVTLARALAAGLSLGLTSGLMVLFRRGHPPAGATTLIVSLGLMTSATQLTALMVAIVLLVLQGQMIHRMAGTFYPLWAPPRDAR